MSSATSAKLGRIVVEISSDGLSAFINLRSPLRAGSATEDEVVRALKSEGIAITDSARQRVSEFVEQVSEGKPLAEPFLVAEGRPARDARNESLKWDDRFQHEMEEWLEDAPADFYTFNSIITVEKSTLIGTLCAGTRARDGVDVRQPSGAIQVLKGEKRPVETLFESSEEEP